MTGPAPASGASPLRLVSAALRRAAGASPLRLVSGSLRGGVAGLLLASLAACATRPLEVRTQTLGSEVAATRAIVLPPPGGPSIVTVVERNRTNGVEQELALSTIGRTSGQNAIYVTLLDALESAEGDTDFIRLPSISRRAIENEMDDRLPGIHMRVSPYFVQNKYGPFGYAVGRSTGGDTCLYGWQNILPAERSLLEPNGAIAVRVRLCEPGAPEEALLRLMYDYSVVAHVRSPGWNPYGEPPPVSPTLGSLSAPVYPISRNGFTRPVGPTPTVAAPLAAPVTTIRPVVRVEPGPVPLRPAVAPVPQGQQQGQQPLEGFPTIPPP